MNLEILFKLTDGSFHKNNKNVTMNCSRGTPSINTPVTWSPYTGGSPISGTPGILTLDMEILKLNYIHREHAYHFKLNVCLLREITLTEIWFYTLHAWNQNFFSKWGPTVIWVCQRGSEHIFGNFIIQILKIWIWLGVGLWTPPPLQPPPLDPRVLYQFDLHKIVKRQY